MGKTIRRKAVRDDHILETTCYSSNKCPVEMHCSADCPYRDNDETISRYRRDTHSNHGWKGSAPSSFRRMLNRERRAKDKAKLRYINKTIDQDVIFDKWVRDAGWLYW